MCSVTLVRGDWLDDVKNSNFVVSTWSASVHRNHFLNACQPENLYVGLQALDFCERRSWQGGATGSKWSPVSLQGETPTLIWPRLLGLSSAVPPRDVPGVFAVSEFLTRLLLIQHRQFSQGPHCTRSPALACVPSKAIRFNCSVKTSRGSVRLLARSQQDTQFLERRLRVKIQPLLIILQRFCVGQAAQRLWPSSLMANCDSFFPILTPLLIWSICFQSAETCVPNRCDTRYLQRGWRSCSCGEHLQSVAVTLGDGTAVTLRFELRSDDKCCVFACFWFVELEMGSKFKLADGLCLRGRVKTRCKGFKWQLMVSQVIVPIRRLRGGWPLKIAVKSKLVFGLNWIGVTWSFS